MVECPKCDAVIDVEEDELSEGESLICEECGARLAVIGLDPLELEEETEAPGDGGEDFEDEDEEDEEFEEEGEEEEEDEEDEDWQ
jgi:alpha-aminoadipate/glutamate carrier protein LysW